MGIREAVVEVTLTKTSAKDLAEYSTKYVGYAIELRVNGRRITTPVIREPLLKGALTISGAFSLDQAKALAKEIKSGGGTIELEVVPGSNLEESRPKAPSHDI